MVWKKFFLVVVTIWLNPSPALHLRRREWPPGLVYNDPASPPSWMIPSAAAPTLPMTAPPPVPASLPTESALANMPLYFYAPQPGATIDQDSVWPPSPPRGRPELLPGRAGMRQLTLLDAHGAEYAKPADPPK